MENAPIERTLVILKPDAVERKLVGEIIRRLETIPLMSICAMKIIHATRAQLDKHFPNTEEWIRELGVRAIERNRDKLGKGPLEFFGTSDPLEVGLILVKGCRDYYLSGSLVPMILQGPNIIQSVREMLGNAIPFKAAPGTIRGDFREKENLDELARGAARNLLHASSSREEADREIKTWFPLEIGLLNFFEPL